METCNYTKIYLLALSLFVQLKLIDLIASHFLVVFDVELQIRLGSRDCR